MSAPRRTDLLDTTDEALIELLKREPRATNRSLAAATNLSEPTVASRIEKLEADGQLRVMAIVDPRVAGYRYDAVFGIRVANRHPDDVALDLARVPEVVAVASTLGRFELVGIVYAKSLRDLSRLLHDVIGTTQGVVDVEPNLVLRTAKLRADLGTLRAIIREDVPGIPLAGGDLDDLDWKIVELLQLDGRMSYREIGRRLHTPEATVRSRLQRLESSSRVHLEAVTDLGALPTEQTRAWVALRVQGGELDGVSRLLAGIEEIMFVGTTLGRFNLIAAFAMPSRQKLLDIVFNELAPLPGVRQIETWELARSFKHDFRFAARIPAATNSEPRSKARGTT